MSLRPALFVSVLAFGALALAEESPEKAVSAPAPVAPQQSQRSPADPAALDALFRRWTDAKVRAELEAALKDGLDARPEDFELLWRKARLRWSQADRQHGEAKKKLGKEAWELGEKASKLRPERVEGHYWAGVGVGAYSQAVGIMSALTQGLEGKYNGFIDRAIQLDAAYLGGAALAAKGRYFFELPWPKRNLDRSVELLTQVNTRHPQNLRAWLFRAEAELARGKPELAMQALEQVEKQPGRLDPADAPYTRSLAKKLRPEVEKKLKK